MLRASGGEHGVEQEHVSLGDVLGQLHVEQLRVPTPHTTHARARDTTHTVWGQSGAPLKLTAIGDEEEDQQTLAWAVFSSRWMRIFPIRTDLATARRPGRTQPFTITPLAACRVCSCRVRVRWCVSCGGAYRPPCSRRLARWRRRRWSPPTPLPCTELRWASSRSSHGRGGSCVVVVAAANSRAHARVCVEDVSRGSTSG